MIDPLARSNQESIEQNEGSYEYVKINNQFVVPVLEDSRVTSLVLIALSLEVSPGQKEAIFAQEPRIRDSLLQVMFDHANIGGFSGAFTENRRLDQLRRALTESAKGVMGEMVHSVLIQDIARQQL
jgi:hypothetical protein